MFLYCYMASIFWLSHRSRCRLAGATTCCTSELEIVDEGLCKQNIWYQGVKIPWLAKLVYLDVIKLISALTNAYIPSERQSKFMVPFVLFAWFLFGPNCQVVDELQILSAPLVPENAPVALRGMFEWDSLFEPCFIQIPVMQYFNYCVRRGRVFNDQLM